MSHYVPSPFELAAIIACILLVGGIAFQLYRIARRVRRSIINYCSPQKTYHAVVIDKRQETVALQSAIGYRHYVETEHYVTFQFRDGDRREYYVDGSDYGLLREGDRGVLMLQGTWFCEFDRTN